MGPVTTMADAIKVKNTSIKQNFFSMDYGEVTVNIGHAMDWFARKENQLFGYVEKPDEAPTGIPIEITNTVNNEVLYKLFTPDDATVDNILKKCGESKTKWINIEPNKRTSFINIFAQAVEKNLELLTEIDICSRGILSKDTKNSVTLLVQYLQFYASYASSYSLENSSWKPRGLAIGIISNSTPLAILGAFLGPALASGYNIVLQTESKISPAAAYLIELATSSGIPEGVIRLIPGNVDLETVFNNKFVSIVSVFDNLFKEKYRICNPDNKKIINLSPFKIPLIVFENADLDSACQVAVNAVWSHQGTLPWSVGDILVQENVLPSFIDKLKSAVSKLSTGPANSKLADVSCPTDSAELDLFKQTVQDAAKIGLEVYSSQASSNAFSPTLLIGGKVYPNNVMSEDDNVPVTTVLAFRTISEAASLANNSRQGFAASVWTENLSTANEITCKLKVSNVWINCFGMIAPDVPISPFKSSGGNYFGGREGFMEYVQLKTLKIVDSEDSNPDTSAEDKVSNAFAAAKKAQPGWNSLSTFLRARKIVSIVEKLESSKSKKEFSEKWLNSWIDTILEAASGIARQSYSSIPNYTLSSYKEPRGIIMIETNEDEKVEADNMKLIIAAMMEGNAIILVNQSKDSTKFYTEISKSLPAGVMSVIPYSNSVVKVALLYKELYTYIAETHNKPVLKSLPLVDVNKISSALDSWEDALQRVTYVKNMWTNSTQSFA